MTFAYLLGFVVYHPFETWFLQPAVIIATGSSTSVTATITTATAAVPSTGIAADAKEEGSGQERRPSWRLRVDNGDRSKVCPVVCACTCWLNVHLVASRSCHLIHHSSLQDWVLDQYCVCLIFYQLSSVVASSDFSRCSSSYTFISKLHSQLTVFVQLLVFHSVFSWALLFLLCLHFVIKTATFLLMQFSPFLFLLFTCIHVRLEILCVCVYVLHDAQEQTFCAMIIGSHKS